MRPRAFRFRSRHTSIRYPWDNAIQPEPSSNHRWRAVAVAQIQGPRAWHRWCCAFLCWDRKRRQTCVTIVPVSLFRRPLCGWFHPRQIHFTSRAAIVKVRWLLWRRSRFWKVDSRGTVPLKAKKLLETKPFLLATDLWSMCHLEKVHFISYVWDRSSFGDPAPPVFWL